MSAADDDAFDGLLTDLIDLGLQTEAQLDAATDAIARGELDEAAFVAEWSPRVAAARRMDNVIPALTSLPMDVLGDILVLAACTRTLALASRACKVLRAVAATAARERASDLGYDEELEEHPDTVKGNPVGALYALHENPATAMLPEYGIPVGENGLDALRKVRTEFAHFAPHLCRQLNVMPADASDQIDEDENGDAALPPGAAEYANLAALYCSARHASPVEPPSTALVQAWIEGGWAEGFDAEGRAHFGGKLVGKTGEANAIGASDMLVALWHQRFKAVMIEFDGCSDIGQRIHSLIYEAFDGILLDDLMLTSRLPSQMPMLLQWAGHSVLIVGATGQIEPALLVCDPHEPGVIMPLGLEELSRCNQYQLLMLVGTEPSHSPGPATKQAFLWEMGQKDGPFKGGRIVRGLALADATGWNASVGGWELGQSLWTLICPP